MDEPVKYIVRLVNEKSGHYTAKYLQEELIRLATAMGTGVPPQHQLDRILQEALDSGEIYSLRRNNIDFFYTK